MTAALARFDLVIVGGGLFGLATALEASRRGRRVVVLERDVIPSPMAASTSPSRKIKSTYRDPEYSRLGVAAIDAWLQLERAADEELFIRLGNLVVSTRPDDPWLEEQAQNSEAAGGRVERLGPAELRARFPQFRLATSANYEPGAGFVRAAAVVRAIRRVSERAGVTIHEGVPVERVDREGLDPVVWLADGRAVAGDQLVIAAGGWSAGLLPELARLITLRRAGVAYVTGLPALFDAGALPPFSAVDGNFYGFPRWRSEPAKFGWHNGAEEVSTPDFDRNEPTPAFLAGVEQFLEDHLGVPPSSITIDGGSCLYDVSPASDFLIDAVPGSPGLFVVTGSSGHGFKFGSIIGRVALDRLDDRANSSWWMPRFSWDHALSRASAAAGTMPI